MTNWSIDWLIIQSLDVMIWGGQEVRGLKFRIIKAGENYDYKSFIIKLYEQKQKKKR